jgi:peptidoglycan-associated lipoprotein
MRGIKFLAVSVLALAMTGCSCRTADVLPGGAGDQIGTTGEGGPLKDINFAFDSYKLDGTAKSILNGNAAWLKENAGQRVQIEGHCDERGTNEYNMVLGANRARSTMDYLRSAGVESSRMSTVSYGEEMPLDPRHNEEAWAKNRRAHFVVGK